MKKINNIKLLLIVSAFIIILYLYSVINQDKEGYASTDDFKLFYDDLDRSFPISNTNLYDFRILIMGTLFEAYQKMRVYPTSINQKIMNTTTLISRSTYMNSAIFFILMYILLFDSNLTNKLTTNSNYTKWLAFILIKFSLFLPNPGMIKNDEQLGFTTININNRCVALYINSLPPSSPDNIDNNGAELLLTSLKKCYTDYINGTVVADPVVADPVVADPAVNDNSTLSGITNQPGTISQSSTISQPGTISQATTMGQPTTMGQTNTIGQSGITNNLINPCNGCLYNGDRTVNYTPPGCSLCGTI